MFDFIAKLIKGDRSRSSAGSGDAARQGDAHPARGDLDAAEVGFRRALAKDPNDIVACVGLGAALCARQRHAEAEPLLRRALSLDPRHRNASETHRLLGTVLNSRGDRRGAIEHLTEALQEGVGPQSAYRDLCLLLFQSGQVARATEVARQGTSAYPGSADLQTYLGNLLGYGGDHDGAADCYRRALSIGPTSASFSASRARSSRRSRATAARSS
jgi:tetratricopeptide (TPR) repeat protein